jgi:hypothetical protein
MDKKIFILGMTIIFLLTGCSVLNNNNINEIKQEDDVIVGMYPPLIYVNDMTYQVSSGGDYYLEQPQRLKKIGETIKKVSSTDAFPKENFVSNSVPEGTEIYYDEEKPEEIYAKIIVYGETRYVLFNRLNED